MFTISNKTSSFDTFVFATANIGSVIGIIVTFVIISNLIYHYVKLFIKSNSEQSKTLYILITSYAITTFLVCCSHAFLRSNALNGYSVDDFSVTQCMFGYCMFWFSGGIGVICIYSAFTYRIILTFRGSIFTYKPIIYKIFLFIVCANTIFSIYEMIAALFYMSNWVLYVDNGTNFIWCGTGYTPVTAIIICSIIHVIAMIALLYMFIRGLYLLNCELVKQYIQRQTSINNLSSIDILSYNSSISTLEKKVAMRSKRTINDNSLETIMELHGLIKKQSILVSITVVSTLIFWLLTSFGNITPQELVWDFTINVVCTWLMLGSSGLYWRKCKKYGFCKICYLERHKKIKKQLSEQLSMKQMNESDQKDYYSDDDNRINTASKITYVSSKVPVQSDDDDKIDDDNNDPL